MFDLWLGSNTLVIVLVPFVVFLSIALLIVWVTHKSPARAYFASCTGIPGPFFASVAVLFALFASSPVSNKLQRRNANAETAVFREADGIPNYFSSVGGQWARTRNQLKRASLAYLEFVLNEELPKMRKQGSVPNKLGAVRNFSSAVLTASLPPAVQTAMIESLVTVREARLERRALSGDTSAPLNWLAVIALGILTQIAVAVVQLDKVRPQALALFVFTTAFATTVALIGVGERPFSNRIIDDEPLREALTSADR